MRLLFAVLALCMLDSAAQPVRGQQQSPAGANSITKGEVIPRVACTADPSQTYALYLPASYSPERKWPILYAFDPEARGKVPVELFREAAEKYGYIVVGSNNSQNGPVQPEMDAADAMWRDTHQRFSIDTRRVYMTGFSGGARMALSVALLCKDCTAGVIAQGAGFPGRTVRAEDVHFDFFASVGDLDFNYPELVELEKKLDAQHIPNRLRRFSGSHQWAPPEVAKEAIEWMELRAMVEGRRPRDEQFIASQLAAAQERVKILEDSGNLFGAYEEVRKLPEDFAGLTDTTVFSRKASELAESQAVRQGEKREKDEIAEQESTASHLMEELDSLGNSRADLQDNLERLRSEVEVLRNETEKGKDPEKIKVAKRSLRQVLVHAYEGADDQLIKHDPQLACARLQVAAAASPKSSELLYELARTYALSGQKKKSLETLQKAVANGFNNAARLQGDDAFSSLRNDASFKKLLESLPATR
jgi:dienelactone hydrolase